MNEVESEFIRKAAVDGWIVTKRGWPDFICRRGLEVIAVEVKESDWLSKAQQAAMRDLSAVGLKTFVWTRQGGFHPYPPAEDLVDGLPSRMELFKEIEYLKTAIVKRDDAIAEWKVRASILRRALRNKMDNPKQRELAQRAMDRSALDT